MVKVTEIAHQSSKKITASTPSGQKIFELDKFIF